MKKSFRGMQALFAGVLLCASTLSTAASFPEKPITLVVPFNAGGSVDSVGRAIGELMAKDLGQPVIVENKAGANSAIGASYVARSKPDGYTLLLGSDSSLVLNPLIQKGLPYSADDFVGVGQAISGPLVLVANEALPVNNVAELIAYAKQSPEGVTYGSTGIGGVYHLTGEVFSKKAGVSMLHVPYTGGAPALTALVSNQVDLLFTAAGSPLQYVKNGKLRALAVLSNEPLPSYPGVPTMSEAGIENFDSAAFYGLVAPVGTPPEVLEKLNRALNTALKDESYRKRFTNEGYIIPKLHTAPEFEAYIQEEREAWRGIVNDLNITIN